MILCANVSMEAVVRGSRRCGRADALTAAFDSLRDLSPDARLLDAAETVECAPLLRRDAVDAAIEGIETASFLSARQKRDIFYDNAARFLRLSPTQRTAHRQR